MRCVVNHRRCALLLWIRRVNATSTYFILRFSILVLILIFVSPLTTVRIQRCNIVAVEKYAHHVFEQVRIHYLRYQHRVLSHTHDRRFRSILRGRSSSTSAAALALNSDVKLSDSRTPEGRALHVCFLKYFYNFFVIFHFNIGSAFQQAYIISGNVTGCITAIKSGATLNEVNIICF